MSCCPEEKKNECCGGKNEDKVDCAPKEDCTCPEKKKCEDSDTD